MDTHNDTTNAHSNAGGNTPPRKIVWKRSSDTDADTGQSAARDTQHPASEVTPHVPFQEVSARAAVHASKAPTTNEPSNNDGINDLKAEINRAFAGDEMPKNDPNQHVVNARANQVIDIDAPDQEILNQKNQPLQKPLTNTAPTNEQTPPKEVPKETTTPALSESPETIDQVTRENHEALLNNLKNDIQSDFEQTENTKETGAAQESSKGIEQTYYSDLSRAMSSNEPATMSELIQKSRFEKKESKILSPKSRKNIFFIAGAAILLVASIIILSMLFGKNDKVEFVTEKNVSSLVRSELNTGINVTGLESSRIKQAIRKVIEKPIPQENINQIYYLEQDGLGNLRRLGVKDIFEKTDNQTPTLLYDNIENNFTHGVYKTDKSYPFIILKTLSYDRALLGMKEWEPTMIDDLATYLDLPPEATDRSLLEPGFEDDLIKNKNVRVARFLPREADKRGILETISEFGSNITGIGKKSSATQETETETTDPKNGADEGGLEQQAPLGGETNTTGYLMQAKALAQKIFAEKVFAQDLNLDFDGGKTSGSKTRRVCYNKDFPGETFDASYEGQSGYYCVDTIDTGEALSQVSSTDKVCFDPITGKRTDVATMPSYCFESYECTPYRCFLGNTQVASSREGEPGVTCREAPELGTVYHESDPRYIESRDSGRKICREFIGLRSLQSIDSALLCFDETGKYYPNFTGTNEAQGITCIAPQSRKARICVTPDDQLVREDYPGQKICFDRTDMGTSANLQCNGLTVEQVQQQLAQTAFELRFLAGIANLINLPDNIADSLIEASDFLYDVAYGNILQVDAIREGALWVQRLEEILNMIDPNLEIPMVGSDGGTNLYGYLRGIIQVVKCGLGIGDNLQWITLDRIDIDTEIYAGQSLPQVEPIQQTLVLIGLMDPVSVTGTLDLVSQDAISQLQLANGIEVNGIIDTETALLINRIIEGQDAIIQTDIINGLEAAIINDYFIVTEGPLSADGGQILTMGAYNGGVQNLQIILYTEGYNLTTINGLFDRQTCSALQEFQDDHGLERADDIECTVSSETREALNQLMRDKNYLGSGFYLNPQGFLQGTGILEGTFGPGVADFSVNPADADRLREGDVVLMYMFLDEQTILIARDQAVIEEIVKRRALSDIFK